MRSRSSIAVAIAVLVSGCAPPVLSSPSAPGSTPSASRSSPARSATPDFDGDGQPDLAVGLGTSTGRVSLRYGSGRSQELTRADLDGSTSADFGQGLLARDLNGDGYTDLVVGDPDLASERGPAIFLLFGGPGGLDASHARSYPAPMDSGDFGIQLALVERPEPVLAVGAGYGSGKVGGSVLIYRLGGDGLPAGEPERLVQGSDGIPGTGRPGDGFGTVLAATGSLLVVGAPRKDVGRVVDAGAVAVLTHLGGGRFTGELITQGAAGLADRPERDDRFGSTLAAGDGHVLVGAPLEDVDGRTNVGLVQPFQITGSGVTPLDVLTAETLGSDVPSGTAFGRALAMARPCAGTPGVLIGSTDLASGDDAQAGGAWLVSLGSGGCVPSRFFQGEALGGAEANGHVGSPLSALRTADDQADTLVIAARGEAEEGVLGSVWTLKPPYGDPAVRVLDGIRVHEERELVLSPPQG